MGITRIIAKNGMKGRKKVSILMILVLTLTFTFIVASITLENSINVTKAKQRAKMYGDWQAAYLAAGEDTKEQLLAEEQASTVAVSTVIGEVEDVGTVASINQELVDVGNLKIAQGKLPENKNEIVIEASVADALGFDDPIGQKIKVTTSSALVDLDPATYLQAFVGAQNKEIVGHNIRQMYEYERQEDFALYLSSEYYWNRKSSDKGVVSPSRIKKEGTLCTQSIKVVKEYTICGVIDSYSIFWDTGEFKLGNAFVSQEEADDLIQAIKNTKLVDLSKYQVKYNVFLTSESCGSGLYDALKDHYLTQEDQKIQEDSSDGGRGEIPFRKNTYSYPEQKKSGEHSLTILVIGVIFLVTVCAILQIFLTQIKKRTRKIALLKSIGATNHQIASMLIWEGCYLLMYSMPLGLLVGFAATYGGIQILNVAAGMSIHFYLDTRLLVIGVIAGCIALFVGMAVPMIQAMYVPLVGGIQVTSKKQKRSTREQLGEKEVKKEPNTLTFSYISKQHEKLNRNHIILTKLLTIMTASIVLVCLLMGYLSFGEYIDTVVVGNRPNYVLKAGFALRDYMVDDAIDQVQEKFKDVQIDYYKHANGVYISYDQIKQSELINTYKKLVPRGVYSKYIGSGSNGHINGAIISSMYGMIKGQQMSDEVLKAISVGKIDQKKFQNGECVILAIPMYQTRNQEKEYSSADYKKIPSGTKENEMFQYLLNNFGKVHLSYDALYNGYYKKDETIKPGDEIWISQKCEPVGPVEEFRSISTEVAGIIYYDPNSGLYPLFEKNQGYVVIASEAFFYEVCPAAQFGPARGDNKYLSMIIDYKLSQAPHAYGETYLNIRNGDNANAVESISTLFRIASNHLLEFVNYNDFNWDLFNKALNLAIVVGILGATSLLIAAMILYNIQMSAFEQERARIGVLQALGVTNREFELNYLKTGARAAIVALIIGHIVEIFVLALINVGNAITMKAKALVFLKDAMIAKLAWYPWVVHVGLCILLFVVIVMLYYVPARQLKKYSPNENISG